MSAPMLCVGAKDGSLIRSLMRSAPPEVIRMVQRATVRSPQCQRTRTRVTNLIRPLLQTLSSAERQHLPFCIALIHDRAQALANGYGPSLVALSKSVFVRLFADGVPVQRSRDVPLEVTLVVCWEVRSMLTQALFAGHAGTSGQHGLRMVVTRRGHAVQAIGTGGRVQHRLPYARGGAQRCPADRRPGEPRSLAARSRRRPNSVLADVPCAARSGRERLGDDTRRSPAEDCARYHRTGAQASYRCNQTFSCVCSPRARSRPCSATTAISTTRPPHRSSRRGW
jgi:hypothetical protein